MNIPAQRRFFAATAVLLWLLTATLAGASDAVRPNIILILADDVGAETISAYGGESYLTPHIDELARDGVRFEYAHAQPLCTPSRVKIMTGQYNFRNYKHFGYLDPGETTFAHLLKDAGYNTAVAGKWQLYNNRFENIQGSLPVAAGFEEFLLWQLVNEDAGSRFWAPELSHNGVVIQHDSSTFGPDVFNDYVLNYISQHKAEPFFIYYPMVLAHDPWVTTPDMRNEAASDQEKFAAMMTYMDKLVGKVRSRVEAEGLANRTVILFIGDNGTGRDIVSRQRGVNVRGAKGRTIDTGSRVPFVAWGPGRLVAGLKSDSLVNLNDVLPTLAELAKAALPVDYPGDGASLVPTLTGQKVRQRDSIFIHYEPFWPTAAPARYAFDRRWKLYDNGDFFDMQSDSHEKYPLDLDRLGEGGAGAYQALHARLQSMPGELSSNWRWFPPYFYQLLGAAVIGLVLVLIMIRLSWRYFRQ